MKTAARAAASTLFATLLSDGDLRAQVTASAWDLETADGAIVCRMLMTGDASRHGNHIKG